MKFLLLKQKNTRKKATRYQVAFKSYNISH